MDTLTSNEQAQFERAVAQFVGDGEVQVTDESIRGFLDQTSDLKEPTASRLRRLAIRLENEPFERGWVGLRTLYQAAATADPSDPLVMHSWGISAQTWMQGRTTESLEDRRTIADESERVLVIALDLAPRTPCVAHSLGLLFYDHPERPSDEDAYLAKAELWFSRALEWEPKLDMARLYLAHCLHDRREWERALSEYEHVDLARLAEDWPAWRVFKCREQFAHCHAEAGHVAEAIRQFTELLDEMEAWSDDLAEERIVNLDELVDSATRTLGDPELLSRVRDLSQRFDWFETRYPRLHVSAHGETESRDARGGSETT